MLVRGFRSCWEGLEVILGGGGEGVRGYKIHRITTVEGKPPCLVG